MEIDPGFNGYKPSSAQYNTKFRSWGFTKNKRAYATTSQEGDVRLRQRRQTTRPESQIDLRPDAVTLYQQLQLSTTPTDFSTERNTSGPSIINVAESIGQRTDIFDHISYLDAGTEFINGLDFPFMPQAKVCPGTGQLENLQQNVELDSSYIESDHHFVSNSSNFIEGDNIGECHHSIETSLIKFSSIEQPILRAAKSGNTPGVKYILQHASESADMADGNGITPLLAAAEGGHLVIVELLLSHKANVHATTNDTHRTSIHQAAEGGHVGVVQKLLDFQAFADSRDVNGASPLWSAAQRGHCEIVKILLQFGADKELAPKNEDRRPIHKATQNGHVEVVKALLEAGAEANPDIQNFGDETPSPLWLAAQIGSVDIGKLLIEFQANLESTVGSSKRRPIHQAVQHGHAGFVELLIKHKADVNTQEEDGWTPLMMASQEGHLGIVDLLLKACAKVDECDKDHMTALWIASQKGHIRVVKRLFEAQAKLIPTKDLRWPIHQAAQNNHFEVVRFLVEIFRADVNAKDMNKATPLLLACQGPEDSRIEMIKFLREKGADLIISL